MQEIISAAERSRTATKSRELKPLNTISQMFASIANKIAIEVKYLLNIIL